jgi:hypothetical protein
MSDFDRPLTPEEQFLLADATAASQALISNSNSCLLILGGALTILTVLIQLAFSEKKILHFQRCSWSTSAFGRL